MTRFSRTLSRLRKEAGFPTPYAFYHRNGGKRSFPFTYAYYTKIERGLSLPRGEWLPLLIAMLRIRLTAESQRELILAYLRDLIGSEKTFSELVAPLLSPPAVERVEKRVIKRLIGEQAHHATLDQFKAILSSEAAYWIYNCLLNNAKPMREDELAAATDLPPAAIRAAATKLLAAKCLKKSRGGALVCPIAGRYCVYPRGYRGYASDLKTLEGYIERMHRRRGGEVLRSGSLIRTRDGAAAAAAKAFMETLEAQSAESVYEADEDSGFFAFETRIRKVFPF